MVQSQSQVRREEGERKEGGGREEGEEDDLAIRNLI